jgi:hypothetical protein
MLKEDSIKEIAIESNKNKKNKLTINALSDIKYQKYS